MNYDNKALKAILSGKEPEKKTMISSNRTFNDEQTKKREVGEIWYETNPITKMVYKWEQKKGYRVKLAANLEGLQESIREQKFKNCELDCTRKNKPSATDLKFNKMTGRCVDCQVKFETELKRLGKYKEYEQNKIKQNLLAWIKDAEQDLQALKDAFEYEFTNDEGYTEKWTNGGSKEVYFQYLDDQFQIFKTNLFKEHGIDEEQLADTSIDGVDNGNNVDMV